MLIVLTHYRPAMPFGNSKLIFEDRFSSVLSQLKKYHSSGNLKFNNLGIFQSLKLRILLEMFSKAKFYSKYLGRLWVKGEREMR